MGEREQQQNNPDACGQDPDKAKPSSGHQNPKTSPAKKSDYSHPFSTNILVTLGAIRVQVKCPLSRQSVKSRQP